METYADFASVYDTFMDDTPYEEWAEYIVGLLKKYGIAEAGIPSDSTEETEGLAAERRIVLDLGCGTGTLTQLLAEAGYDMIGIDNSQEMLNIALAKRERSGKDILYLLQDMREFELYGTVGAVISVCDSLNYLLEEEELYRTFRLVNNYLYPGGIFIFDFNTTYKYETVIGDVTIAENREDCSFIWENYYDSESGINEYDLTVFVRIKGQGSVGNKENNEYFHRFTETHYQRGYSLSRMCELVEKAGMQFIAAVDADTHGDVREESERIYVIARECGKEPING
ncbi:MAG: class I SAM-dependent methyltransferase [Clostridiales bacterium]|nr:class I SAM-dependent methyltransferase [Clostridiales bacterium]